MDTSYTYFLHIIRILVLYSLNSIPFEAIFTNIKVILHGFVHLGGDVCCQNISEMVHMKVMWSLACKQCRLVEFTFSQILSQLSYSLTIYLTEERIWVNITNSTNVVIRLKLSWSIKYQQVEKKHLKWEQLMTSFAPTHLIRLHLWNVNIQFDMQTKLAYWPVTLVNDIKSLQNVYPPQE